MCASGEFRDWEWERNVTPRPVRFAAGSGAAVREKREQKAERWREMNVREDEERPDRPRPRLPPRRVVAAAAESSRGAPRKSETPREISPVVLAERAPVTW